MKCIITVLGKDKIGIIAKVSTYLADLDINVLDISQSIIEGYFNMIMIVDITKLKEPLEVVREKLSIIGTELKIIVTIQHEDIFNSMHRI